MRLFVALPLAAETRAALAAWTARAQPALRWTPADQLHITLLFLGEVDADLVGRIVEALDGISLPAFTVRFVGVEALGRAGVLVAAVEPIPPLLSLADAVRSRLGSFMAKKEDRAFHPHATLARSRHGATVPKPHSLPPLPELTFAADCFRLYRSDLQQNGAVHTVIREWKLA